MDGRVYLRRAAPWVLCWISLGLLLSGVGLRIALPEANDDGLLYAALNVLEFALVPLVGALIASRLPANPYGWLWCALGLAFGVQLVSDGLLRYGAIPGWLSGTLIGVGFASGLCLLVFVLLLFPTGRLPGRHWRWLAVAAVGTAAINILLLPFAPSAPEGAEPSPWAARGSVGNMLAGLLEHVVQASFLLIVVAAGSVLVRFRRAEAVERQQLKWFVLAAVLASATVVADVARLPVSGPVWSVVDALSFALLPVAVAIAVLRYRLYEIDRIVSRTVSYGLLTAALIGLYLVVVALLRPVLEPLTGSSSLAVAASTLAVAAVFNPARRRLQAAVDRRFDRARYDAARAVQAFAARLRTQVDLDEVTEGLRDTVAATVAPTRVAVWLRVPSATRSSGVRRPGCCAPSEQH
jgi:hypothetical protein